LLKPVPMSRVLLVGLREDKDRVLSVLHDLRAVQIETLSPDNLALFAPDRPDEEARAVADEMIRIRSLLSALPPLPVTERQRFADVREVLEAARAVSIDEEVRRWKQEEDQLLSRRQALEGTLELVRRHAYFSEDWSLLSATHVQSYLGEAEPETFASFQADVSSLSSEVYWVVHREGPLVRFVLTVPRDRVEAFGRLVQRAQVRLEAAPRLEGRPAEIEARLRTELAETDARLTRAREALTALARDWYPRLVPLEEQLTVEARKNEILGRLGGSRNVFALEGWVPTDRLDTLRRELERTTGGRTYVTVIPTSERPPTLLRNPRGFSIYEFFIRFYSLPQSAELDPTLVFALVFPIFFGLMLGDVGYGAFILAVCLWLIWRVDNPRAGPTWVPRFLVRFLTMIMPPRAMKTLAKALVPGCVLAIGLGVAFDEYFGFSLAQLTGGRFNFQLFDPIRGLGRLLVISGWIGLGMVTLGLLFGILNEIYVHGSRRRAAGKGGWILVAWSVSLLGYHLLSSANPLGDLFPFAAPLLATLLAGIVLILGAEGGQALIELPSIVSHVLSFTRLVGILMASVVLALVIDSIATGLFHSGIVGALAGAVILVVGQVFNIILGVFEPGIQGARLIYVEYFSKFYQGNGRGFQPFGSPRRYTLPQATTPSAHPPAVPPRPSLSPSTPSS